MWQIIDIYHATSIKALQVEINTVLINIHLWKLIQRSLMNMNSWKSDEVIEAMIRRICNNLISKRDWKSKLRKTSLQLKQKWMKETLKWTKMKRSHFYTSFFWTKSLKMIIVANKKMSIKKHSLDTFTLKQRVYLNDSDSKDNVTAIMMKVNWKLNKRLRKSILIITHHEKLKRLIARAKHLVDVATANRESCKKIYKIYSDSQIFLKTVKVMTSTRDQTRLRLIKTAHENIHFQRVTLKLHWVTRHARMLKNKAIDKMIDDVHKLSLSLIKHQRTKIVTWLTLIQKQVKQTWRIVWREKFNAAHFWYLMSKVTY